MRASLIPVAAVSLVCVLSVSATAQWINYPTPGIPACRTATEPVRTRAGDTGQN
jgi:hypothetical protein